MRSFAFLLCGLLWWHGAAAAQTINDGATPQDGTATGATQTGVVGANAATNLPSYAPLSASERLRRYFVSTFGPGAVLRAAAAGGITQWTDTPKEWKQGSEAYGERFGSSFAQNFIRQTLEAGAAAALHEDDRYFRSTDTGFWRRTKHAVGSAFVARNGGGGERFAFSRIGAAAGAAFISRAWQPPTTTSAGDAAVSFGITMAADMGWNMFKEFRPRHWRRRR
jgi:hypothetical protein